MEDRPRLVAEGVSAAAGANVTLHGRGGSALDLSHVELLTAFMMDGSRTVEEIAVAVSERFDRPIPVDDVATLAGRLAERGLLDSGPSKAESGITCRPAAHAGAVYPADTAGCVRFFEELMHEGCDGERDSRPTVAVISPHIDYARGRDVYARLWGRVRRDRADVDRVVVFGTSHYGGDTPFVFIDRDFETPLGTMEIDRDVVEHVDADGTLRSQAQLHMREHSIELQLPFIQRIWPTARLVPVLCGQVQAAPSSDCAPRKIPGVDAAMDRIAGAIDGAGGTTLLVAGADLAHVGRHFGDDRSLDAIRLEAVETADRVLLGRAAQLDGTGVWEHLALELDSRRVCGFGPIWSMLELTRCATGELVAYDQAVDWDADLAVSYAGMVFRTTA